jgi:hypothetical protein
MLAAVYDEADARKGEDGDILQGQMGIAAHDSDDLNLVARARRQRRMHWAPRFRRLAPSPTIST